MRVINSVGAVANRFVNRNALTNPQGTTYDADWGNDVQDELVGIQDEAAVAQGPGTDKRVLASMMRLIVEMSKPIGELFTLDSFRSVGAWVLATPRTYFPAICLSTIDIQTVLDVANYPDLVPHLRAKKLWFLRGKTGEVGSWAVTVSGSSVTFPNTTSANALLAALLEDQLVHGSYTNWRTLTIAGSDFAISNVNTVTRVATVIGSPTSGSQTAELFPHRIVGSTTTAREFEVSGRSIIATNDAAGRWIGDLRMRSYFQGHLHSRIPGGRYAFDNGGSSLTLQNGSALGVSFTGEIGNPSTDTVNGTPRTGPETHSPTLSAYIYKHAGRYVA